MWPILFYLGGFAVHSYGVLLAVAVLVGLITAEREAKRRGIDPDFVLNLAMLLVVAGIIGSRIVYVLVEWPYFAAHPQEIPRVWDGGLSFYGAVIVAVPLAWLYSRKGGLLRFGDVADITAVGAAAGYPFARIGCFLNGCCYGKPTTVPWAVAFPFDGVPRHPTQLYAVLFGVLIFGAILYFRRRQRFAGQLAILYLVFYSVYRFFIDFFRVSPPAGAYLTLGQAMSLLVAGVALVVLAVRWRGARP
uniref:Phosphatidylglycerol--prolipoprotein diacylglyceryl transferase n=1 Tax=Ammonifex degensii TaxID=42838 RepID=A0A7C2EJH5_9THEO